MTLPRFDDLQPETPSFDQLAPELPDFNNLVEDRKPEKLNLIATGGAGGPDTDMPFGGQAPKTDGDTLPSALKKALIENAPDRYKQIVGGIMQSRGTSARERMAGRLKDFSKKKSFTLLDITKTMFGLSQEALPYVIEQNLDDGSFYFQFKDWLKEKGRELYKEGEEAIQANQPEGLHKAEQLFVDAARSIEDMSLALGVGYLTKSAAPTLAIMGTQVYGQTYGDSVEQGLDPYQANARAKFHALAEIVPETIPVMAFLRRGTPGVKRFLEASLGEGGQESLTSVLQQVYDSKELDGMSLKDALLNIDWKQVGYEGLVGLAVGTTLYGGIRSIEKATGTAEETSEADISTEGITPQFEELVPETQAPEGQQDQQSDVTTEDIKPETKSEKASSQDGVSLSEVMKGKESTVIGSVDANGVTGQLVVRRKYRGALKYPDGFEVSFKAKGEKPVNFGRFGEQWTQDELVKFLKEERLVEGAVVTIKGATQPKKAATAKPKESNPIQKMKARQRELRAAQKKHSLTANQEKEFDLLNKRLAAKPGKWKIGDGIGWRVIGQVNRGFRITKIHPETLTATITQVADTGLTTSGGADRISDHTVYIGDLVRDRKYDTPESQLPEPEKAASARTDSAVAGTEHVPLLFDKLVPERRAEPRKDKGKERPIRREDAIRKIEKTFGVKIYSGRVKGKRVGFYRRMIDEIRVKRMNDLEVVAHEFAHWLDFNNPQIGKIYHKQPYHNELKGVSYDVKKLTEGFAEFVRLYMTQEQEAVLRAPQFYDKFIQIMEDLSYKDQINETRDLMHAWYNQGSLQRFKSKQGKPPKKLANFFSDITDRLMDRSIQNIFDELQGFKIVESELAGTIQDADLSPYKNARLAAGSRGVTRAVFEHGSVNWDKNGDIEFTGIGLRQIFEPVADVLDDTLAYFAARRAAELKQQGRENLFEVGEIKAGLELGKNPKIKKAFDEWRAFSKRMMDFYQASGLLNSQQRKAMEEMNKDYVPFHRVWEDVNGMNEGRPSATKPFKRLKGGTANINDILDNIANSTAVLIDTALKNKAKLQLYNLISSSKGGAKFAARIPKDVKPSRVDIEQVKDTFLRGLGIDPKSYRQASKIGQGDPAVDQMLDNLTENLGDFATFFTFGNAPVGKDIDSVMDAGKRVYFEVGDPILWKSLNAWGPRNFALGLRIAAGFKTTLTRAITTMPSFQIPNLLRDSFNGYALSRGGIKPLADSVSGMVNRLKADEVYWEFLANGGGFSSTVHGDTRALRNKLEKLYIDHGLDPKRVLHLPSRFLEQWDEVNSAFEYGTRLAEFKALRKKGASRREAAYWGREISTDFGMRGSSDFLRAFTTTVPFMNARMQGLYRLAREVHEKKSGKAGLIGQAAGQFALRGLVGITIPTLILYAMNKDDERYQALPEWIRDLHWVIFTPNSDTPILIPKPFEVGTIFATVPERMFELIETRDGKRFVDAMLWSAGETFALNPVPQIIKPFYELSINEKFTGGPIIPEDLRDVDPAEQYRPWTTETMVQLGKELNMSPMKMEHTLRGYLGTLGMYVLTASDGLFFGPELRGEAPTMRTDEYPVIRRFLRQQPYRRTQYEDDFYNMAEKVRMVTATFNKIKSEGRAEDARDYLQSDEAAVLFGMSRSVDKIAKVAGELNRAMRIIRQDKNLPADEKRRQIDDLQARRNQLFETAHRQLDRKALKKLEKKLRDAKR